MQDTQSALFCKHVVRPTRLFKFLFGLSLHDEHALRVANRLVEPILPSNPRFGPALVADTFDDWLPCRRGRSQLKVSHPGVQHG